MIYNGGAIKELESTKERPPLADILEGMGGGYGKYGQQWQPPPLSQAKIN